MVKKFKFFQVLLLSKTGKGNVFDDILKQSKDDILKQSLVKKFKIFNLFLFGKISQKNVFVDILEKIKLF